MPQAPSSIQHCQTLFFSYFLGSSYVTLVTQSRTHQYCAMFCVANRNSCLLFHFLFGRCFTSSQAVIQASSITPGYFRTVWYDPTRATVVINASECLFCSSKTVITENTLCRIWHCCNPFQIVHRKPNVKNYSVQMSIWLIRTLLWGLIVIFNVRFSTYCWPNIT